MWRRRFFGAVVVGLLVAAAFGIVGTPGSAEAVESSPDPTGQLAMFNPNSGEWHIRYADNDVDSFFYGTPGDAPLLGDWDCDGVDTVAMFRPANGFIYLRNSNSFGVADVDFFYGIGGDIPLAGDWNGDGCDTFSIYRPSEGKVYVSNRLGTFPADYSFYYGVPGDKPFAGDFDGDGTTSVGLYRDTTGFVYFRDSLSTGVADFEFFYGAPSDRIVAADWDGDGDDTVGIFRPDVQRVFLSNANVQGFADVEFDFGEAHWLPVGGEVGVPLRTFGDGIYVVGSELYPGTYRAASLSGFCYWVRLSGFGGTFEETIAFAFAEYPQIVTIEPGDLGFESDGCGTWTSDLSPITASPTQGFGDGVFIVGVDIAPGTWRSGEVAETCYWERRAGFLGTSDDVWARQFSDGRTIVTISADDIGFESDGCGTWTLDLSPITSSPTAPFANGTFLVGSDIAAGTWQSRGDFVDDCYWERLSGFTGDFEELIDNDFTADTPVVTIAPTDVGFFSDNCGTWDFVS